MKRVTFDDANEQRPGSRPAPNKPRHTCAANGCSLTGAIAEHSGAINWWCQYHYGAKDHDFARINAVLSRNRVLVDAINEGRSTLVSAAIDPSEHGRIWSTLRQLVLSAGIDIPPPKVNPQWDDLAGWVSRVERVLSREVGQVRTASRSQGAQTLPDLLETS